MPARRRNRLAATRPPRETATATTGASVRTSWLSVLPSTSTGLGKTPSAERADVDRALGACAGIAARSEAARPSGWTSCDEAAGCSVGAGPGAPERRERVPGCRKPTCRGRKMLRLDDSPAAIRRARGVSVRLGAGRRKGLGLDRPATRGRRARRVAVSPTAGAAWRRPNFSAAQDAPCRETLRGESAAGRAVAAVVGAWRRGVTR